ncbi:MAG: reductive dehalogenase domain-containing protein [Chloroflexota bacterium]
MSIATLFLSRLVPGKGNGGPSMDEMLEQMDKELENFSTLVQPAPESKPRTPFDSPNLPGRGPLKPNELTPRQFLSMLPVMVPLVRGMSQSAKMYDGHFQPVRNTADPSFIKQLEAIGREAGVRDIKYVKVPPNAIFKHKGIPYEYAVIVTVEMDKTQLDNAPSFDAFLEVAKGYKNLAVIGNKMARFMRRNGYAAYPGTALGGVTDYVYLAELAGLGASGYHGLLITPGEGARLRINTIYTNITNLPIETENEHLWVRDFCAMCRKCIRQCPVDAIFDQPVPRGDGGMQCIDHNACRDYFAENYGCAICLIACPFSQAGYEQVKARFKGNPTAPQFRIPVLPVVVAEH